MRKITLHVDIRVRYTVYSIGQLRVFLLLKRLQIG